ncbi:MAG: DUF5110 domain-containing protein, partial [Deltaproteobacteria bacterium]|nr:DUF5110 domain-containing protein [Deltaproteobacteria bacterium]
TGDHFVKDALGELVITPVWPGDAVFPDFTSQSTRDWWGEQLVGLLDVGVRGVWIDMNEPATFSPDGFPLDSQWAGEGTLTDHRETHNVFALLMAQATTEGLKKFAPAKRPFVLTRAGFAGIQRHAAVWTGDTPSSWEHLAMAPATLMNMGLSGVAFVGSDVGGFSGDPGGELYARWIQLGALSPFFRTHVATDNPPQEPWSFGAEVESISRKMIELRYRRLPYLYSLMRQAQLHGDPALRPLVYDFPDDAETATLSGQLMLGRQLMAAPVLHEGQTLRRVYLPAGTWTDYHDDTAFVGPAWVDVAAPLAKLPLFVRENGILPAWDVHQYVGEKEHTLLYVDLYPVADAPQGELSLYLDDGESPAYQDDAYQLSALTLTSHADGATFAVGKAQGSYTSSEQRLWLVFHGVTRTPTSATVNGQDLQVLRSLEELRTKDGWYYDAAAKVGYVSLGFPRQGAAVVLSYDATRPIKNHVDVSFEVNLPPNSPLVIYFASSLGGWQPGAHTLVSTGANTATLELTLQAGETVRYKYTGGTWDKVERGPGCASMENREVTVRDDGSHALRIVDTVESWAHQCR